MKKNFFGKVVSMLSVLAMLVTCVAAVPAYAAEVDVAVPTAEECETLVVPRAGEETIKYAEVLSPGGFILHDDNLTPVKTIVEDARIHRMVLSFTYRIYDNDPNQSPINLKVSVKRPGQDPVLIYSGVCSSNSTNKTEQSIWFPVTGGEQLQFYFDVSSANSADSTGTARYARIVEWGIYCD